MPAKEKRKFKRLPLEYDLTCHRVDSDGTAIHSGISVDVSTGGIFFQTPCGQFEPGNLLKIELSIPPTKGLLEYGGRIAGFAKVIRKSDISTANNGFAAEFCQPLRLST